MSILNHSRRFIAKFVKADRGNVAMIFAVALVPIMGFMGAAIDYSRAVSARSAMQAAIDSTALMVSKDISGSSLTAAQITAKAQSYFNALYNHPETSGITITANYSINATTGTTVTVTGSGTVATDFMKMAGYPTVPIATTSTTTWGSTKLRVALVLDNTGSMADDGKMVAMQTAAKSLIDQLKAVATNNGDVYISIVPFAKDVNVGSSNWNQNWLKFDDWDSANQNCSWVYNNGWTYKCTTPNHNTWNGCITDRDQSFDTNVTTATPSNSATQYPAEQYDSCPVTIMGMSYDWTALKAKVTAMTPSGGTNQAIGLQMGWQTLQLTAPFAMPALDPAYQYKQVIILLSDGLNTQDRWYGNGSSPSAQVDARQAILCNNVKAANVTLYTIQVNTGGDATSSVLQNCASSTDKFFMLTTASQVLTAFNSIGTSLTKLRLTK